MDESKNSRRAATQAEGSPSTPSKNSRQGIARKTGAPEVTPSEGSPSAPSKNSRRVTGAKIAPSEVTPSETPTDAARYDGIAPSESERNDGKATATPLQEDGQNNPAPVGGATPPERTDKPNEQSNSEPSGSPERLAGVEGKQALTGGQHPTPSQDADRHDGSDSPASVAELSAKVEEMKRQQRASALRGALLVFLPPVVLCIPMVILKGCNLLLLSWWWCISPLLLWLIPLASILSIFVQCYIQFIRQQDKEDKAAADKEA